MAMMKQQSTRPSVLATAAGVLGLVIGSFGSSVLVAAENPAKKPSAQEAKQPTQGDRAREARIEQKLDQILSNQQTILQRFDQVMEELRIVKVRATINGSR